jgi:holo-[acyl-carrier protein] synthase
VIYGIGIDIVRIERIRKAVEKWGQKFLKRVFTEDEISYCSAKRTPYLSLAVRFAAKEALIKALGSGIPFCLTNIEVVNTASGQPFLKINGRLEDQFKSKLITKTHLSLSHENEYGIACVVLEQ